MRYIDDRADMGDGYINIVQDGIAIKAELSGDEVKIRVTDPPNGSPVAVMDITPMDADTLADGLKELGRQARGLPASRKYRTFPRDLTSVKEKIQAGHTIDRVATAEYSDNPRALMAVSEFLEALSRTGLKLRTDYASTVIYRDMTEEERNQVLRAAQDEWSSTRALYEKHFEGGSIPSEEYKKAKVRLFCEAEGLPLPWEGVE